MNWRGGGGDAGVKSHRQNASLSTPSISSERNDSKESKEEDSKQTGVPSHENSGEKFKDGKDSKVRSDQVGVWTSDLNLKLRHFFVNS